MDPRFRSDWIFGPESNPIRPLSSPNGCKTPKMVFNVNFVETNTMSKLSNIGMFQVDENTTPFIHNEHERAKPNLDKFEKILILRYSSSTQILIYIFCNEL